MTYMPRLEAMGRDSAQTAGWSDLAAELDRWGQAGRVASLWWRDDDAVTATPRLANLLRIARGAPLALAVIPAPASAALAEAVRGAPSVAVLQHGWRHANRAERGKKSEYPKERPAAAVAAEIAAGRARLVDLFGPRAVPVFVPPWNRIAPELLPVLADNGIAILSTIAPGRSTRLPAGLVSIDIHLDVTDWKGDRGFIGTAAAIGTLVGWLRAYRLGIAALALPIGILTHHLIMDAATAAFMETFVALVGSHAAVRWTDITELLR